MHNSSIYSENNASDLNYPAEFYTPNKHMIKEQLET